MSLFSRGFQDYLQIGKFSDVTLRTQDSKNQVVEYHVHRIVLAYSSEFFARLLMGEFKEASQSVIELRYPDPDDVFPKVLKFVYGGQKLPDLIDIKTVLPLLAMADHYLIKDLITLCYQFISKNVNKNNASEVLKQAFQHQISDVVELCCNTISKNFCHIINPDFSSIPYEIFCSIANHKYLAVKNEFDLYKCICSYIKMYKEKLEKPQINRLMESVRFRWMSFDELEQCRLNPLVPDYLLLEAIMARLKKHEMPASKTKSLNSTIHSTSTRSSDIVISSSHSDLVQPFIELDEEKNIRLRQRISCLTFEYRYDFDDRGIIHYITRVEKWGNKHHGINVTASSIEMGKVTDLLNKTPSELWTRDVPASWFTVDFGPNRSIVPTHYTLRHGGNYKADSLRTWDLQGSRDTKQWVTLRRHNHDTTLTDKFAMHTWTIDRGENESDDDANENEDEVNPPSTSYRYFRILQTGRNSSNHNFLVLSGIEFYGDLYEWSSDE